MKLPKAAQAYFREMGRNGGKKGGRARAESLTAEQRQAIAKAAAKARWGKGHA
jgi:hypothetical protein